MWKEKKGLAWGNKACLLIFVANDYLKNPGHNEQGQQYKQEKVDGIQKITELIMVRETASRWDWEQRENGIKSNQKCV